MTCLDKQKIISLFYQNVRGKKPVLEGNDRHDGRAGHWLERAMGVSANGDNAPDILGYEMKNSTSSKTTFGDWSPNDAIFKRDGIAGVKLTRDEFLGVFGAPNPLKRNRLSWSGSVFPKYNCYSTAGTIMVEESSGDIIIKYDFSKDPRSNKLDIVPLFLQKDNVVLAVWHRASIQKKLEDKFNQKGWFICQQDQNGIYYRICFGNPINYDYWINQVRKGVVYLDSGMYQGNKRPYQNWRASNNLWESLIIDCY